MIIRDIPLYVNKIYSLRIYYLQGDDMYERIRGLREDKDLTQKDLANYLKVHQTTYSDYELGELNIPIPILIKLSHYYNTSIDYLLNQTDNPIPYERKR